MFSLAYCLQACVFVEGVLDPDVDDINFRVCVDRIIAAINRWSSVAPILLDKRPTLLL